jgi:hypothetical protein
MEEFEVSEVFRVSSAQRQRRSPRRPWAWTTSSRNAPLGVSGASRYAGSWTPWPARTANIGHIERRQQSGPGEVWSQLGGFRTESLGTSVSSEGGQMASAVSGSPDALRRPQLPSPHAEAPPWCSGTEPQACSAEIFGELYLATYPALVGYCRRLLGRAFGRQDFPGRCDPEDLAQEALLRAWHARERYSPARPFWPWVMRRTLR